MSPLWPSGPAVHIPSDVFSGYAPDAPPESAAEPLPEGKGGTETVPPGVVDESKILVLDETVEEVKKPWEGSFELGLNGSSGNSDIFNFRIGADAKRETDRAILTLELDYKKDSTDSVDTANRLFLEGRNEWLLGESPWTIYIHGTTEYDEFRPFDARLAADSGLGYQFIKTDVTEVKGRIGAGVSHELGGPDDSYPIEATFGLQFSRQISEKQKLSASVDYFPEFADFMNSRITTKADWEILLDSWSNMSMKVGVIDRYDSTPNGARHNDLDYSVTLLWKF